MSKHWTPKVGDEVLIETQKRSGLANIVSIDLEPFGSDSPAYFVHMRDGSADLWVFREEMEFVHRNEDPTPPPAPVTADAPVETVSDIDERRIAARDQEIQYLQRQIAALKAEVERLRAALQETTDILDKDAVKVLDMGRDDAWHMPRVQERIDANRKLLGKE